MRIWFIFLALLLFAALALPVAGVLMRLADGQPIRSQPLPTAHPFHHAPQSANR